MLLSTSITFLVHPPSTHPISNLPYHLSHPTFFPNIFIFLLLLICTLTLTMQNLSQYLEITQKLKDWWYCALFISLYFYLVEILVYKWCCCGFLMSETVLGFLYHCLGFWRVEQWMWFLRGRQWVVGFCVISFLSILWLLKCFK